MPVVLVVVSSVAVYLILGHASTSALRVGCMEQNPVMQEIYGAMDWYRARPEPEAQWRGRVQKREPPVGPNTRLGLDYTLDTGAGQIPMYAAHVQAQLAPFVEREVLIVGKLIDLTKEGFGQELWIGGIGAVVCDAR